MPSVARATNPRRRDVQGLRAVAVAAVVAFHAGLPVAGGYLGVDVFFVVSGLVITGLLLREQDRHGRLDLAQFYARRFRRLTPALALMVVVTLVASSWVLSPVGAQQTATLTGLAALAFVANVVVSRRSGDYFGAPAETNPLLHTWSLSVEEQFYLVFPALLIAGLVMSRRSRTRDATTVRRRLLAGIAAVSATSLTLAVGGSLGVVSSGLLVGFYSPLPRAWEFGLGAAVAVAATGRHPRWWSHPAVGPTGAFLLLLALVLPSGASAFQLPMTLFATAATGLLLAAGATGTRAPCTTMLSWKPLVALGDRSYSVYLWHWPFIVLAGIAWPGASWVAPCAAAASLPMAFGAFRWVEDPLRRGGSGARPRLVPLAIAVLLPPVLVASAVAVRATRVTSEPEVREAVEAMSTSAVALGRCDTEALAWCSWPAGGASRPVYLVGDSHAGHLSDGVREAAAGLGRDTRATMAYNCPLLHQLQLTLHGGSNGCASRNTALLSQLQASNPGTVVIAASDVYWSSSDWTVSRGEDEIDGESERLHALTTDLEEVVQLLRTAGHDVVLVQSVPLHAQFAWEACSLRAIRQRACVDEVDVREAESSQGRTREAVARAAAIAHAEVLDTWVSLCDGAECRTSRGGVPLYRNWSHLSVRGSERLASSLTAVLSG